jgi:hypothetical protein
MIFNKLIFSWDVFYDSNAPYPNTMFNSNYVSKSSTYIVSSHFEGLSATKGGAISIEPTYKSVKIMYNNSKNEVKYAS